jgi:hypothetical protein
MAKAAKKPREAVVEVFDCEQRSSEWFDLHVGVPTASRFATIMAEGKDGGESLTRRKLLYQLAGERLTGQVSETYRSAAMARGIAMEDAAREAYARRRFDVRQVGFVRRTIPNALGPDLVVGCSPDALVGDKGALEIKTLRPDLMIELLEKGATGLPAHRAQTQGTLWVGGLEWIDLYAFYEGRPGYQNLHAEFRLVRDEPYIKRIQDEVERFEWEIRQLVEKIKRMGGK